MAEPQLPRGVTILAWSPATVAAPLKDTLAGNRRDFVRHAIVREEFLQHFTGGPLVEEFRSRWEADTGIGSAAMETARALDSLAESLGLPHRGALFIPLGPETSLAKSEVDDARTRVIAILEPFANHLEKSGGALAKRVVSFTLRELQLPWLWLPAELAHFCVLNIHSFIVGQKIWISIDVMPPPAPAVQFKTRLGEAVDEMEHRLAEWIPTVLARIEGVRVTEKGGAGRRPRNAGENLRQYARWFYRHVVCGEKIEPLTPSRLL